MGSRVEGPLPSSVCRYSGISRRQGARNILERKWTIPFVKAQTRVQNNNCYPHRALFHFFAPRPSLNLNQALQQDFNLIFEAAPSNSKVPWEKPDRLKGSDKIISKTLFGQRYLSCATDEAHKFRNVGPKHFAVLLIMERTAARFAATATPLHTGPKVYQQR